MSYIAKMDSPVGILTIASNGENLIGLWIEGQKYFCAGLEKINDENRDIKSLPLFVRVEEWLKDYFAGNNPKINFPLAPIGSSFRQIVWKMLCEIPYGKVVTYGEIAKRIGEGMGKNSMSAQAVGGAVGHNPISIIIPCHRVVGTDGSLTGYAGGLKVKTALLELEKVEMNKFYIPKRGTAL